MLCNDTFWMDLEFYAINALDIDTFWMDFEFYAINALDIDGIDAAELRACVDTVARGERHVMRVDGRPSIPYHR